MKRTLTRLMFVAVLTGLSLPLGSYAKGWETAKAEKPQTQRVVADTDIEIKAGGGVIYIYCTKNLNVKIFTILGSRIADDTLAAGSHQFVVPAHGVYIVKAGDLTCKVAV